MVNENDLDQFLKDQEEIKDQEEMENIENKKIKGDKSLVERVDKKIIVEDGRQLLI